MLFVAPCLLLMLLVTNSSLARSLTRTIRDLRTRRDLANEVREKVAELQELRSEVAELHALKSASAELSVLKEQVADLQALKTEVAELRALKMEVAQLEALKVEVAELLALKEEFAVKRKMAAFSVDFGQQPYRHVEFSKIHPVHFNRVLLNLGLAYDFDTGVFTAPEPGVYLFALRVMGSSGEREAELGVYSAAAGQFGCIAYAQGTDLDANDRGTCLAVMRLGKGEDVYVKYHFKDPYLWGSPQTSFVGVLLHAE